VLFLPPHSLFGLLGHRDSQETREKAIVGTVKVLRSALMCFFEDTATVSSIEYSNINKNTIKSYIVLFNIYY
jgi:hypothetical protein